MSDTSFGGLHQLYMFYFGNAPYHVHKHSTHTIYFISYYPKIYGNKEIFCFFYFLVCSKRGYVVSPANVEKE